jgi:tetratricopeptide (TPR) repeat protein
MTTLPTQAVEVFYSYAHKDEKLRSALVEHLSTLQRQGYISEWHDRHILAGTDWAQEIDTHLNSASLILLLISPSFIASDYCYGIEMQRALERHHSGQAHVIPIIMRPTDLSGTPFAALQFLPTTGKAITTWQNRDKAMLNVANGIRKVIVDLTSSAAGKHSPKPSSAQPLWNVPYPRNPLFTGREQILERLAERLNAGETTALAQTQAISGLGGIGKTQTAIEYAYRFREHYQTVLWTRADTRENLIQEYVAIARLLQLPEQQQQDQPRIVEAVKRWLREQRQWLLILDNADDLGMIRDFLPETHAGHILLTTRAMAMGRVARRIELDRMEQAEGILFLLRRASILQADEPLDKASSHDQANALAIVQAMDGLPLALDQAGAYIEETRCGLAGYLARYQQRRRDLLQERGGDTSDHPEPVATTWSLSFEKVEQASPAAADLLRFCAFLAPDTIPEELVTEGAAELTTALQSLATDPYLLDAAVKELFRYSLIQRDAEQKLLSVHRLVQAVLKDTMDEEVQRAWAERTVRAVNRTFLADEFANWDRRQRLLTHAQSCADLITQWDMEFPVASRLLGEAGSDMQDHGLYAQAEPLLQRALFIDEKRLGPDHPDGAIRLNNLARLYSAQGRHSEAEALSQRALAISEQAFGPDHPGTAHALQSLAGLYWGQGKYAEAEALLQRALEINEHALGADHPGTATTLNHLAHLYREQGKYTEAEPLFQHALEIKEQALGPDHPDIADILTNVAHLYRKQGKYAEAEALLQRALEINKQVLGPDHINFAFTLNSLAKLYRKQGKYAEAEALYQYSLAINEQALGPDHPDIAWTVDDLAELYWDQGKYAEAEAHFQRSLAIREQAFGPVHHATAIDLNGLADLYREQGKYVEAEPLYRRSLAIKEQTLAPDHPSIMYTLENYATLLQQIQRTEEAAQLEERAWAIRAKWMNNLNDKTPEDT